MPLVWRVWLAGSQVEIVSGPPDNKRKKARQQMPNWGDFAHHGLAFSDGDPHAIAGFCAHLYGLGMARAEAVRYMTNITF